MLNIGRYLTQSSTTTEGSQTIPGPKYMVRHPFVSNLTIAVVSLRDWAIYLSSDFTNVYMYQTVLKNIPHYALYPVVMACELPLQSGFQIHVRSAFWIAPLMSLAPNSPLHFSKFLSRSKSQEVSNIFWQMFYNQKFQRKIWVNTVFWLFCWELFSRTDIISAVIISTWQWSLESLDPHFSCNLTSN
jgi:hypothetical protein